MRKQLGCLAFAIVVGVLVCPASVTAADTLSYPDLVGRLIDLEHLATLPADGETTRQWSSWDRRSEYDAAAGKYVNWAANGDGTGVIRREGDREVLAEMDGPGSIWRIWSARAQAGSREDLHRRSRSADDRSAV